MFIVNVLKDLLANWKILITVCLIAVLGWKCHTLEIEVLEQKNTILTLENNEKILTQALEESQKSVKTLEEVNNELSKQIEEANSEMNRAINTQRKLQKKINSLEQSGVKSSPDNPNKPIEHFYFDSDMVDIINRDILRKK